MPANTWVKVLGFSDVERHSLNTLFRLSERLNPAYALWTSDQPSQPHVVLIDLDSYEGGMELASPRFNSNQKFICVGDNPPPTAWRSFQRPVDWSALVRVLDELFVAPPDIDIALDPDPAGKSVPPGVRTALLVGLSRGDALYLRARLSLAGITEVDDVETAALAAQKLNQRQFDLVVVSLELIDADPWALVQALVGESRSARSVIVATDAPSWRAMEHAERLGCTGLLEIPFVPQQVLDLIQKI
jgi:CheY-like chemotaxis protein